MHGRIALASILLLSAALAGCADEAQNIPLSEVAVHPEPDAFDAAPVADEDADAVDPVADDTTETGGSQENSTEELPTGIPDPSLEVAASGEYAPLPVEITIDATDGEEDLVSWVLTIGDLEFNGTEFPSVVSHTFEEAGAFNVTLMVADEAGYTSNVTQTVEVFENPFPWTASALNAISCIGCSDLFGAAGCIGWGAGVNGIDCVWFELPKGAAGHTYEAFSDFPLDDPDGEFFADCTYGSTHVGDAYSVGVETGKVPEGAGCLVIWEYAGGVSTITVSID